MINFSRIKIKFSENQLYSFVGIQKCQDDLLFHLPKGLKNNLELFNAYEIKKNLFFLLYKTLKKFASICEEKGYFHKNIISDRDGVIKFESGSGESVNTNETITLYNKLNFLDSLLEKYDELKIMSLAYRLGATEHIKDDRIYSNLHRANFLENGAIYLDTMQCPRPEIHFQQTDIIYLYCYLLTEVKYQLEEEVTSEIESLAERYKEKYLYSNSSLFNQSTYEQTLDLLTQSLEDIDHKTVYKDSDYWDFYEAIEKFLYSDFDKYGDGEIWGINNFCNVWESACLSYLLKTYSQENILLLDTQYLDREEIKTYQVSAKILDLDNNLWTIKVNNNQKNLRPDSVVIKNKQPVDRQNYSYKLYRDRWNDYSWETIFRYITHNDKSHIRIAFRGQEKNQEIIEALENHFKSSTNIPNKIKNINKHIYKSISIDKKLPDNFFSYWELPQNLTDDDLIMMQNFNHIFYQAFFIQSLKTSDDFVEKFALGEELIIQDIGNQYFGFNKNKYDDFLMSINNLLSIEIIDFKYISEEEIRNKENIEQFKSRSIRKQFLYEYLLNEYLVKQYQIKQPKISSCFWIPKYNLGEEIIVSGNEYLDGYINLALVNPVKLLQSYVQS